MTQRPDTLPHENMYAGHPPMYLHPAQSRYHNVGQNGLISPGDEYPGKRGGMLGDYGPRQVGSGAADTTYPYPTDYSLHHTYRDIMKVTGAQHHFIDYNTPNDPNVFTAQ